MKGVRGNISEGMLYALNIVLCWHTALISLLLNRSPSLDISC
jgi:hypothetical protein